jgi:hypothetical protein
MWYHSNASLTSCMVLHPFRDKENVGFSTGGGSIASPKTSAELSAWARNGGLTGGGGWSA